MKEWTATNYAVVYSPDLKHLVKEVQKLITEGWSSAYSVRATCTQRVIRVVDRPFVRGPGPGLGRK